MKLQRIPEPPNINWYYQEEASLDVMMRKFKAQHEENMSANKNRLERKLRGRRLPKKRKQTQKTEE